MDFNFDSANTETPSIYWAKYDTWVPLIAGGAEGDSGDGDGTSTDNDQGDGTSADKGEGKGEGDKLFTQDQMNAIAAREADRAKRGLLNPKDAGFDSAKEMKEWIESQKQKAEADKTEDEKAREEAIEAAKREAENGVLSKANERLRKAEFLSQAVDQGVRREARDDAYLLAQTIDSWSDVQVDDDGKVTGFDEEFFKTLKETKPFLFAPEGKDGDGGLGDIGAGQRGAADSDDVKLADLRDKYSALR